MSNLTHDRFKDAPWYKESKQNVITLLGLGGIGSNTMFNLYRSIPAVYIIVDFDTVESHNIGTQLFMSSTLGSPKTLAIKSTLNIFLGNTNLNINTINKNITEFKNADYMSPIVITGFDNMVARRTAFEHWKSMPNREIFIDGRLRANLYEVYSVLPGHEDKYEETLFNDEDVSDGPCTFKQTSHFGMLIGARITQIVANYLSNKADTENQNIYEIPFKIKELGELCHVELVYY